MMLNGMTGKNGTRKFRKVYFSRVENAYSGSLE